LRTSGGEVTELLIDGQYAGSITLVYREGERIAGAIQLERESIAEHRKAKAIKAAQNYVQQMVDALGVQDCEVIVTSSRYDHIIASEHQVGVIESFQDDDEEPSLPEPEDDEIRFVDVDPDDLDRIEMREEDEMAAEADAYYELVIVGESRNRVEYHIYERDQLFLAEAMLNIKGRTVTGDIHWMREPDDDEIEHVADLVISDFDPDEVDRFVLDMKVDGELIETFELDHKDRKQQGERESQRRRDARNERRGRKETIRLGGLDRDYTVRLVRDDGDALTYDIFEQSFLIGQATIDIASRKMTGFIDFHNKTSSNERARIASILMRELDKEKDYESLNLTMMYRNKPIDELMIETETVH
jgi:hypothetical protein